jgi:hypothetical protein
VAWWGCCRSIVGESMTDGWAHTAAHDVEPIKVVAPSVGPLILAGIALVISAVLVLHDASHVALASVLRSELIASAIGYVLTPYVVVAALVWGRADGLSKQFDPWFDRARQRHRLQGLQLAVVAGFVVALGHIVRIARWVEANLGSGV